MSLKRVGEGLQGACLNKKGSIEIASSTSSVIYVHRCCWLQEARRDTSAVVAKISTYDGESKANFIYRSMLETSASIMIEHRIDL